MRPIYAQTKRPGSIFGELNRSLIWSLTNARHDGIMPGARHFRMQGGLDRIEQDTDLPFFVPSLSSGWKARPWLFAGVLPNARLPKKPVYRSAARAEGMCCVKTCRVHGEG
jgi:hypothetical protein